MSSALRAALAAAALLGTVRVGVAPAEHCPAVSVAEVEAAERAAVHWFEANQRPDGRWAYLVDESGRDLGGYNVTRHAGVLLSLEEAANRGIDEAATVADDGLAWALDHLVEAGGGRALVDAGDPPTGASALFVRALLERGDDRHDEVLLDVGRFLVGQVLASGEVSARYSMLHDAAAVDARDRFFTGEAFWAFVGLADRFPDVTAFADAVEQVGAAIPFGDQIEDRFPPTSDHWASYAYADLGVERMSSVQLAHARRLAGIVGVQVRGESTRWEGGLQRTIRRGPAVASGLGTLGEAGAALLRAIGEQGAPGLSQRLRCIAGMLVERQTATGGPDVVGAWFTRGVTRMDDQQHALSALLFSRPAFDAADDAVGGGEQRHSLLWLALAALVVPNAARPTRERRRWVVPLATAGLAGLALLSGPVLDTLDVSPASARAAAGAALAVAAVATVLRPAAAAGTLGAALAVVALAVGADDGAGAVLAVIGGGVVVGIVPERWRQPAAARAIAVVALVIAADLVIDGVLGV